ncbi:MAG: galactose mutarotase [Salinisphaera sp.]|jgi:aldose 1-epimerase|nr:galactose mutarotase [Salinisphaera sp.]
MTVSTTKDSRSGLSVSRSDFGTSPGGTGVERYSLRNRHGLQVDIITFGARIQAIHAPDKNGQLADVVLGFDDLAGYVEHQAAYFGATIGRFGNRIANGRFSLDGNDYRLPVNDDTNTLHGGTTGFDSRVWAACPIETNHTAGVELTLMSADGDMGFPGTLAVTLRYTLDNDNNLTLHYSAICDAPTVINLTHHSYFNMAGAGAGTVLGQLALFNAPWYTPVDDTLIPTGEIATVEGTPLDFQTPTVIGQHIENDHAQLKRAGGYDHNWVLGTEGRLDRLAARVTDPASGRTVELYTTEPGVQVYTGNGLDGHIIGKHGRAYAHRGAFTLETQHYPDSPNQPDFPSTRLEAHEKYTQTTIYRFLVDG